MSNGAASSSSPALALTPAGALRFVADSNEPPLESAAAERIAAAFARGPARGLLHLGAVEVDTPLPPAFAFFRDLARLFMTRLCSAPDLEERRDQIQLAPPRAELESLARGAPPMRGGEYLDQDVLERLWAAAYR